METITLTFGDCGENHVGMQKIGQLANHGFNMEDMMKFVHIFRKQGVTCELVDITTSTEVKADDAYILIIRKGIDYILGNTYATTDMLFDEQKKLRWDKYAYMYGRVVSKHARYNLCYADNGQEPDYEKKKGRIVAFDDIPLTKILKTELEKIFQCELVGEGNRYFDINKCGIGYHGDTERRIVIGCRLGAELPLHYNWFYQGKAVGKNLKLHLRHGDIYVMSEKAVGFDWKKQDIYTLRHATGCEKYTKIKE